MTKTLKTLLLTALVLLPATLCAQLTQTLVVADGGAPTPSTRVPFYANESSSGPQHTQIIYHADSLGVIDGQDILGIKFFLVSAPATAINAQAEVRVKEIAQASLTTFMFLDASDAQVVYTGSLGTTSTEIELPFVEPYNYQGGNLLIDIVMQAGSNYATYSFVGAQVAASQYVSANRVDMPEDEDDEYDYEYSVPTSFDYGDRFRFLPKMELTYGAAPTCQKPTALTVAGTDPDSAVVTWTAGGDETQWIIYRDGEWTDQWPEPSYTFGGLSGNMQYTIGIRALCAAGDTSRMSTVRLTTDCGLMSDEVLPWTYNFDTVSVPSSNSRTFDLDCWVALDKYSSWGPAYPRVMKTGENNAIYFMTGGGARPIVALPRFESPLNQLTLTFRARYGNGTLAADTVLEVGVLTDDTLASSFVVVDTAHFAGGGELNSWQYFEVPVEADLEGRIAFRYNGGMQTYVDDIAVAQRQACDRPQSIAIDGVGDDNVSLTIADPTSLGHYGIRCISGSDTVDAEIDNAMSGTVYGLKPARRYDLSLWGICYDGDTTTHISATFRTTAPAYTDMPYYTGFEQDEDTLWATYGHPGAAWVIDTAAAADSLRSLYISADGGLTNGYVASGAAARVSYAVRSFDIAEGQYIISFDWRCMGEISVSNIKWDWMRVVLAPEDAVFDDGVTQLPFHLDTAQVPDGWMSISNALAGSDQWQHFQKQITIDSAGIYQMVVVWRNDVSGTNLPAAAIDNIVFEQLSCPQVADLTVDSVGQTWAAISWTSMGGEAAWLVSVDDTVYSVDTTAFTVTGLQPAVSYTIGVSAVCTATSDTSSAASVSLLTLQQPVAALPYATGFEATDDRGWYCVNGHNGWFVDNRLDGSGNYALYVSADGGANPGYTVGSHPTASYAFRTMVLAEGEYQLTFDWKCKGELNSDYVRGWLAPVDYVFTADLLPNGSPAHLSTSYWQQSPEGWIDVAGGKLNGDTAWQHSVNHFDVESAGTYNLVFMWVNDNSQGQAPAGVVDNIELCMAPCPQVDSLVLVGATETSLTIGWTAGGGENQWQVTANGSSITVSQPQATISGLQHSTAYEVQVRSICPNGESGIPVSATFRTECGTVGLPYVEDFEQMQGSAEAPCWTLTIPYTSQYGTYPHPYHSNYSAYSGEYYMYGYMYSDGREVLFASPAIEMGDSSINVSFHAYFYHGDMEEAEGDHSVRLQAGVMSDANDASTFVPVIDTTDAIESWGGFSFDVARATIGSAMTHVAFRLTVLDTTGDARTYFGLDSLAVEGRASEPDTTGHGTEPTDTTGIALAAMGSIALCPNPASSEVTVGGIENGATVCIVDINGREIYRAENVSESHRVNVASMARGTYFVRVTDRRGVAVRKLILK